MATVVVARHGETTYNRESRIQGWIDSELTDRGRDQARNLATVVEAEHDVDRTVASDLDRARETAAIVADASGVPDPELDDGWRERHAGIYQDRTAAEIRAEDPDAISENDHVALRSTPEDGEGLADLRERVLAALERTVEGLGHEDTALVVAHGGPIRVLLGEATDTDLVTAYRRFSPDNCSRSVFEVGESVELVETDARAE